jgi:hypothetical protein
MHRRMNPAHDPGPPKAKPKPKATPKPKAEPTPNAEPSTATANAETPDDGERRLEDRRSEQRRGGTGTGTQPAKPPARKDESGGGWRD